MCSMISSQCDELRKTADELDERAKAYAPTGRNVLSPMLRSAADTILELRDDLQRANEAVQDAEHDESMTWDRVRKAEAENVELRELVQDMHSYFHLTKVQGLCQWGPSIMRRIRDLGIEVQE